MIAAGGRLIDVLVEPGRLAETAAPSEWEHVLGLARAANLIGTLGERLLERNLPLPAPARRHLEGAAQLSARQRESVRWEAQCLDRCLAPLGIPVVLLKGSAYVMAELPVSRGRLFGDVDILVPREQLGAVEVTLMTDGWTSAKLNAYDQRYYRQWMHELPPMVQVRRGTMLDIHHTLLPLTARLHPDPGLIFAASAPIAGFACLRTPSPHDLVIHSITHLVHEGELPNGLRDLVDIDGLLRHFGGTLAGFWETLVPRAQALELAGPLFLGLHLVRRTLATPIPAAVLEESAAAGAPGSLRLVLLDALYRHALPPPHASCRSAASELARWLLYVRAHWLRMPPHLLAIHLTRKAWRGWFEKSTPVRDEDILPG